MKEVTKKRALMRWMIAVFILTIAWFGLGGKTANAETIEGEETYISTSHNTDSSHILDPEPSTSGVTELDEAANRTNTLVTWVCGWIGGLMALFGIIWAAINQASHNSEGRNQGIIVGAIGIVVAFAPQITNMILGR